MIDRNIIVKRYGIAFVHYARPKIGLPKLLSDLRTVNYIHRTNAEFMLLLKSFDLSNTEKMDIVNRVLKHEISDETIHFLELLINKKRIELISDIFEFLWKTYSHEDEEDVVIKTTLPMDLDLLSRFREKLQAKYKKKMKFYIDLDATLLGGIQVIIGNKIIDGSVRKRLNDLRNELKSAEV